MAYPTGAFLRFNGDSSHTQSEQATTMMKFSAILVLLSAGTAAGFAPAAGPQKVSTAIAATRAVGKPKAAAKPKAVAKPKAAAKPKFGSSKPSGVVRENDESSFVPLMF